MRVGNLFIGSISWTLDMILIKLGGSVITDKTQYRAFRQDVAQRLANEIADAGERCMIVHGAGSYGHVMAHRHSLAEGAGGKDRSKGLAKVSQDVRDLNLKIMEELNRAGMGCISIPPSASAMMDDGALVDIGLEHYHRYLDLGLTPVTFGDVCLDQTKGFGICSGDRLMTFLAEEFHPRRIVFCSDVDGIFDRDPFSDDEAILLDIVDEGTLNQLCRTSRYTDVTGSIHGKLEQMLAMARFTQECQVVNGLMPSRLADAIIGKCVTGSKVRGALQ